MKTMTIRLSDNLMDWLTSQAGLNHRSKNKHVEYLLNRERKEDEKKRYQTGVSFLCGNGTHNFKAQNPAMNEFCNCGMFVFGEVVR